MIRVEELHAVPRSTLYEAIEAGIGAAKDHPRFTPAMAVALRKVGEDAQLVGVGMYAQLGNGLCVRCPVAMAFPEWRVLGWDLDFAVAFDRAMHEAGVPSLDMAARIVDDEPGALAEADAALARALEYERAEGFVREEET